MSGQDPPPPSPRLRTASLPEMDESDAPPWAVNQGTVQGYEELEGVDAITASEPWIIDQPSGFGDPDPSTTEEFQDSYADHRPLVSSLEPIDNLRAEYENGNPIFLRQIDWLVERGYVGIRRARGDGDCYYRSLAFAYIENIMRSSNPALSVRKSLEKLKSTIPRLQAVGFEEVVYEPFYDVLYEIIEGIGATTQPYQIQRSGGGPGFGQQVSPMTSERLLLEFQDPTTSNSIVMFLRLLTSAELRGNPEEYQGFLFNDDGGLVDVPTFCASQVDPVGKEADHVQVLALARALKINVNVAYLDGRQATQGPPPPPSSAKGKSRGEGEGRETTAVDFHQFQCGEGEDEVGVTLLYRPGHYDILDERREEGWDVGLL